MSVEFLERPEKHKLAYVYSPATKDGAHLPLVMFCGGYRSDMQGTKATFLEEQCKARGQAFVRFDYSGHGQSEGLFEDGTIGEWYEDALAIFDHINQGGAPVLLVGSSMGGWIALLVARARTGLIKALMGLAAAPDFTESIYSKLNAAQRQEMEDTGVARVPNDYSDEPYAFSRTFYEEAKEYLLLDKHYNITYPIRLIQGGQDKDVPWQTGLRIQDVFDGSDSDVIVIEDAGHSLSRPEDLEIIDKELRGLSGAL